MNKFLVNDKLFRLIGIPLLSLTITIIIKFGHPEFFSYWFFAFLHALITWEGCRMLFFFFYNKFPHYHQTKIRMLVQGGTILIFTIIVAFLKYRLSSIVFPDPESQVTFLNQFINTLIPTICVTLIYESIVFFKEWKFNVIKTELLARENIQSQLEVLKNQLDPHFLFNSLNTLASLIDLENKNAQQYLERLSDVYRYVLVSRNKSTVTLGEEMTFLNDFVYLNKIRFRDNLQVINEISSESYIMQVAPLSIQMLVENALKHNIFSKEKPLYIYLKQENDGYLSVENYIQPKSIFNTSTKVGLENIRNRYHLLSEKQVEIIKENGMFKVRIPLLKPNLVPVTV